jgi:hypothetical protein
MVDITDQEGECLMNTTEIFAGKAAAHGGIGAHTQEHGIVFLEQVVNHDILADGRIQSELNAHFFEDAPPRFEDGFFKLEGGDAEGEQTTDLRVAIIDHRMNTMTRQNVGATKSRRPGAHNGNTLVGGGDLGHIRTPAQLDGFVRDVFFDRANRDRPKTIIQGAGTFAEAILRADQATDFWQGVGFVRHLGGFEQVAFGNQFEPVGNVIMDRAFPFAVRIAAFEAAIRLLGSFFGGELTVNFVELLYPFIGRGFFRILSRYIQKLEIITHCPLPVLIRCDSPGHLPDGFVRSKDSHHSLFRLLIKP